MNDEFMKLSGYWLRNVCSYVIIILFFPVCLFVFKYNANSVYNFMCNTLMYKISVQFDQLSKSHLNID